MRVLITGGTGFVGQNLMKAEIFSSFDFVQVSRRNLGTENYTWNQMKTLVPEVDGYIHLAGKAHDLKNVANEDEYIYANYELTKIIYSNFLKNIHAKFFIFLSSVKAVTDKIDGELMEDVEYNPSTIYGKSKMMAEQHILANLPKDKFVYILRPCMIHGEGNKGNLNLLYSLVSKGLPWPLGEFENKRSFLSVDNLIFVLSQLASCYIPSGIYNLADNESFSTNQLVELIAVSQNKRIKIWNLSPKIIYFLAKIGDKVYLPINSERLSKLTESYIVSNKKLRSLLKQDLPVDAEEGLLKTLKSF